MAVIHFVSLVTHSSPIGGISFWYRISYIDNSLVALKMWRVGDEWIARVLSTFSVRYKDLGDEWVTSVLKWITAVIVRVTITCSVEGDELTSSVKILFFKVFGGNRREISSFVCSSQCHSLMCLMSWECLFPDLYYSSLIFLILFSLKSYWKSWKK